MERKSNYFKIGLFVLCAVCLLLAGLFALGAKSMFQKKWYIETYFNNSVQGLEVGSPVKYLGVKIGTVQDIGFVAETYDTQLPYVRIVIAAKPSLLGATKKEIKDTSRKYLRSYCKKEVSNGYRINMAMQGVTGNSYLETKYLKDPPKKSDELNVDWEPKYPYIPSTKGTIEKIGNSLERVVDKLEDVPFAEIGNEAKSTLNTMNSFMTNDLQATLANIDKTTASFPKEARQLRSEFNEMLDREVHPILTNLNASAQMLPGTIQKLQDTLWRMDIWSADNRAALSETVENMRSITRNVKDLSDSARKYPAEILFGGAPPHPESMERDEDEN